MIGIFLLAFTGNGVSQEKIATSIDTYNVLIENANPGDVIVLKIKYLEKINQY